MSAVLFLSLEAVLEIRKCTNETARWTEWTGANSLPPHRCQSFEPDAHDARAIKKLAINVDFRGRKRKGPISASASGVVSADRWLALSPTNPTNPARPWHRDGSRCLHQIEHEGSCDRRRSNWRTRFSASTGLVSRNALALSRGRPFFLPGVLRLV